MYNRVIKNSVWNVFGFVLTLVITMITIPIMVRELGSDGYGVRSILLGIIAPLGLANLGLGQATIKYFAESVAKQDFRKAEKYFQVTLLFNLVVGGLATLFLYLISNWLILSLFKIPVSQVEIATKSLNVLAWAWFVSQVNATFVAVPTAMQRYDLVTIANLVTIFGTQVVGSIVLLLGGTLLHLFQVQLLSFMVTMLFVISCIFFITPKVRIYPFFHKDEFRKSLNFGIWQTSGQLGGVLGDQADRYLLGILLSASSVGVYDIVFRVKSIVDGAIVKVAETFFPFFSSIEKQQSKNEQLKILLKAGVLIGNIGFPALLVLMILGQDFLSLWVGSEIAEYGKVLLFPFTLSSLFGVVSYVVYYYFLGTGRIKWVALISISKGILLFIFSFIFIRNFGLIGAGYAELVSLIITRPFMHYICWYFLFRYEISLLRFLKILYLPFTFNSGIIIFIYFIRSHYSLVINNWFSLFLAALTLGLTSLIANLTLSMIVLRQDIPLKIIVGKLFRINVEGFINGK